MIIGKINWRGQEKLFGIHAPDRRRHAYVLGQSGVGKTTLLENMAAQDAENNNGFCLIDPHGQLAEAVLDRIPSHRYNQTIYFDPTDDWPISLNVLESGDPEFKDLVASHIVSLFKSIWGEELVGPRSEDLLRNTVFALMGVQGATLLWIPRLLVEKEFREEIVSKVQNPIIKKFWVEEYDKYDQRFQNEVIAPLQNKLRSFLSFQKVRDVVAQPYRKVSMRQVIDSGQILICNLSKGLIGEDNASLLASLIAEELFLSALSRANVPEDQRRPFYLYIDESQTITGSVLAPMLSEARKYALALTISHQYIQQLPPEITQAIFGNVGTIITFRLGASDSLHIEKEFSGMFRAPDFENLPVHHAYIRLSVDGMTSDPFSMTTLPPPLSRPSNRESIIKTSRQRFGTSREFVEEKIKTWLTNPV